jgi:DNA-binding CsgD family transcriptional regulator
VILDDLPQEALDELVDAGLLGHPGNRAALLYGRALLALRTGEAADDLLAEADRALDCAPYWRHLLRTVIAPTAAALGVAGVESWLREADAYCGEARERALQRRAREALRALGAKAPRSRAGSVPPHLAALGITTREAEVLRLVAEGLTNAEVAARLFLSARTVETHVGSLLTKAGSSSRSELARLV